MAWKLKNKASAQLFIPESRSNDLRALLYVQVHLPRRSYVKRSARNPDSPNHNAGRRRLIEIFLSTANNTSEINKYYRHSSEINLPMTEN